MAVLAGLLKSTRNIHDTDVIKAVNLDGMQNGDTHIRHRLGKLKVGMTVAAALKIKARRPLTRSDLRYAHNKGRVQIGKASEPLAQDEGEAAGPLIAAAELSCDEILEGFEGVARERYVLHRRRETRLRRWKLGEAARRNNGRLVCEVPNCGFDFVARYGTLGEGYAQVHHLEPLSKAPEKGRNVTLDELAVVCANCHVMIHVGGDCRPLERLILPKRSLPADPSAEDEPGTQPDAASRCS